MYGTLWSVHYFQNLRYIKLRILGNIVFWLCQHKGLLPYKLIFERNWIYTTTNIFTSWHACMSITSEFYITIKTGTLFKKLVDWSTVSNNFSIFIFGIMWYWNRSVDFRKKKITRIFSRKVRLHGRTYIVNISCNYKKSTTQWVDPCF